MPTPVLISFIAFFQPQPFLSVQNATTTIPPKGSKLFEIIKSSRPKTESIPSAGIPKLLQTLNPRQHGILQITIMRKLMLILLLLDQPFSSIQKATMFSKTATTVESAAKLKNTKNSVPIM